MKPFKTSFICSLSDSPCSAQPRLTLLVPSLHKALKTENINWQQLNQETRETQPVNALQQGCVYVAKRSDVKFLK